MGDKLVAYFSATGMTARVARRVVRAADADLFEIRPEEPYTSADLDWRDKGSRSSIEMGDESSRPVIAGCVDDMAKYDMVFVGFPVWWYVEPRIIDSFLEEYDLAGKVVVPFATSGGSGVDKASRRMRSVAAGARVLPGRRLSAGESQAAIDAWVQDLRA